MSEVKFKNHFVDSRKDFLSFVEEHDNPNVYEHVGKNPGAWIDELDIISHGLLGEPLTCMENIFQPPIDDLDFKELGKDVFLYKGKYGVAGGLWLRKYDKTLEDLTGNGVQWDLFKIGTRASLRINDEYSHIPFEQFLPENFEKIAKPVEKEKGGNKRPHFTFPVDGKTIYAKGSEVVIGHFLETKPGYRLTSISSMQKNNSKREMNTTIKLGEMGVKVPKVIGYYEAPFEEFFFSEKVDGSFPTKFFKTHRKEIIKQDAEMLAALCLGGYRKAGFTDFDDKIFDGKELYLIDVDECGDLYYYVTSNFREILLNPSDTKLREFRKTQKNLFIKLMRDANFDYKDTETQSEDDKEE